MNVVERFGRWLHRTGGGVPGPGPPPCPARRMTPERPLPLPLCGRLGSDGCLRGLQLETVFVLEGLGPPMDEQQRKQLGSGSFQDQAPPPPDCFHIAFRTYESA